MLIKPVKVVDDVSKSRTSEMWNFRFFVILFKQMLLDQTGLVKHGWDTINEGYSFIVDTA